VPEIVPEVRGASHGLNVAIFNLPCRRDETSGERKYPYANFGNDFLNQFHDQLGEFHLVSGKLRAGAVVRAIVTLPPHSPITIELQGTPDRSWGQFASDVADTLIEAFDSIKLRP
jgi:hypothetical protein